MKAGVALLLTLGGGWARAQPAPLAVSVALPACVEQVTAREPLLRLLRLELATTFERPVALAANGGEEANVQVRLDCGDDLSQLEVRIERRQPPGSYRGSINLERLPAGMRPRTIALAVAEDLRWLDEPEPERPSVSPSPLPLPPKAMTAATALAPPPPLATADRPRPLRNPATLRATRNWTLGLGVSSLALTIIGAPILGSGYLYKPHDTGMVAGGSVVVTLALTSLGGAGVTFGYWLRERLRPPPPPD